MSFDFSKPHRIVNGEPVLMTEAELAERQVEEAAWAAAAPVRELARIEWDSGMDRGEREIAIKILPPGAGRRTKAEAAEAAIVALGIRKA